MLDSFNPYTETFERASRAKEKIAKWGNNLALLFVYGAALGIGAATAEAQTPTQNPYATREDPYAMTRNPQEADELARDEQNIINKAGQIALDLVVSQPSIRADEERSALLAQPGHLTLQGFETAPDISVLGVERERLEQIVQDAYDYLPEGFRSSTQEVVLVQYRESLDEPSQNNKNNATWKYIETGSYNYRTNQESLYGGMYQITAGEAEQTVFHESAHRNDWNTNQLLTVAERISFLSAVLDRINAPNRYKSSEVEHIGNLPPNIIEQKKAVEYWAAIFSQYMENKDLLPMEDQRIVQWVISKVDRNPGRYLTSLSPMRTRYAKIREQYAGDPDKLAKINKVDKTDRINF